MTSNHNTSNQINFSLEYGVAGNLWSLIKDYKKIRNSETLDTINTLSSQLNIDYIINSKCSLDTRGGLMGLTLVLIQCFLVSPRRELLVSIEAIVLNYIRQFSVVFNPQNEQFIFMLSSNYKLPSRHEMNLFFIALAKFTGNNIYSFINANALIISKDDSTELDEETLELFELEQLESWGFKIFLLPIIRGTISSFYFSKLRYSDLYKIFLEQELPYTFVAAQKSDPLFWVNLFDSIGKTESMSTLNELENYIKGNTKNRLQFLIDVYYYEKNKLDLKKIALSSPAIDYSQLPSLTNTGDSFKCTKLMLNPIFIILNEEYCFPEFGISLIFNFEECIKVLQKSKPTTIILYWDSEIHRVREWSLNEDESEIIKFFHKGAAEVSTCMSQLNVPITHLRKLCLLGILM